ncbi:MAG TPA: DUF1622 domain-containing protein [Candidatus Limnocylindrales bacterium]|jgi:uncharacterized membrane protein|nr:DUF1622 domain-containing protein [Candidatus Limnocylindrales bacterium]
MTSILLIDGIGRLIDLVGVLAIAGGVLLAAVLAFLRLIRREVSVYGRFRRDVGRGILLGLELLVAADIIRTVAISPTLESIAVLAGIVLVRTVLSLMMEVELTGRWPWQRATEREAEVVPG